MTIRLDRRLVAVLVVAALVIIVLVAALVYASFNVDGGSGAGTG